jgi:hydrogenase 3 maturation protease
MSRPSWPELLSRATRLRKPDPPRVAVVGIGHELRGDDAAGIGVARALQSLAAGHDRLLVIEAGPAPENCTGLLRRFGPDLVLLVDAAQMYEAAGTVHWLPWQDTAGLSASTHTLPPYILAGYLSAELGCEVALLGIQPTDTSVCAPLSPAVREAVDTVVQALAEALQLHEADVARFDAGGVSAL